MRADRTLCIAAASDTVTAAHFKGRHREGKPVDLFGRRWTITKLREVEGLVLVELQASEREGPIMCSKCGSFEWDTPGGPGIYECQGCPHRGPGLDGGVLF